MNTNRWSLALVLLASGITALATPACGVPEEAEDDGAAAAISSENGLNDLPWEVSTDQGEKVVPNVFYAEASENEQVMPYTVKGRTQIDRLIYPTIGNPNLYVTSDPKDSLMVVLRMEDELLEHLKPAASPAGTLTALQLTEAEGKDELAFYLVAKRQRGTAIENSGGAVTANGRDIIKIKPNQIRANPMPDDMPAALKKRQTLRVTFKLGADVPEGLYDIRYDVLKGGRVTSTEFQYNAVRIFQKASEEYKIINVTDTQVSLGDGATGFQAKTLAKLTEFKDRINKTSDVQKAAFITFNGDLHNGGAPATLLPKDVLPTYQREAENILEVLKELDVPIFLTAGNHDGYVATGAAAFGPRSLVTAEVAKYASKSAWPGFSMEKYNAYLDAIKDTAGGKHVDVFTGSFVRRARSRGAAIDKYAAAFKPATDRNMVLYDGFHQWQKTYGPLYHSWSFGRNYYINLNTYDLRQHRRSGWGMYTVNYGGGLSPQQSLFLDKEITRVSKDSAFDIVVLAHHDPRAGHNGQDYPYQFRQIEYRGMGDSAKNYVDGEIINPKVCKLVPEWLKTDQKQLSCLHDGLQEWMLPDKEFDCQEDDDARLPNGTCDVTAFEQSKKHPWYSSYAFTSYLAQNKAVRTLLLGHTHYNSLEILQDNDELVPGEVTLGAEASASLEIQNPVRGASFFGLGGGAIDPDAIKRLESQGIVRDGDFWKLQLKNAGHGFHRVLEGHELVIMRLTSNADLTSQVYKPTGKAMLGFSTLTVSYDKSRYDRPQINGATFFLNDSGGWDEVKTVAIDRSKKVTKEDPTNVVNSLFTMKK